MRNLIKSIKSFATDEAGATMVEYALMVALVAVAAIVAVTLLGTNISTQFTNVAGKVANPSGG